MSGRIAIIWLTVFVVFGQEDTPLTRAGRLVDNASNLVATISVQRPTYVISEAGMATITLFNPTNQALEIPLPDGVDSSSLELCSKQSPYVTQLGVEWGCGDPRDLQEDSPSRVIRPSETITLKIRSDDKRGKYDLAWIGSGTMGDSEGPRLLRYLLGGLPLAEIQFTVVSPRLETWTSALLKKKSKYNGANGEPLFAALKAYAITVQLGEEHIILVAKKGVVCCDPKSNLNNKLFRLPGGPYVRVASLTKPVVRLTATADAKDLLTIQYTTADGSKVIIQLDEEQQPKDRN